MGRPVTGAVGRAVAGAAAVAVLALAGCSDEQGPTVDDPVEPTTSEPTAPTSSAAAEPEPWEERSKNGAVAFVGHWVDTFSQALLSGETAELSSLSGKRCVTCRNFVSRIDQVYEQGGSYEAGAWTVVATDIAPGGTKTEMTITLRVRREAERYKENETGPIKTFPSSEATFSTLVMWSGASWQMTRMQLFA